MKLGLGLYRWMLTRDNLRFAKQAGATHIIGHLVNYFRDQESLSTGSGSEPWGLSAPETPYWTEDELRGWKELVESEGLVLEAIENFEPAHWYDIILDGPKKQEQLEHIKTTIRNMGKVGIPIIGYNFSVAGVWGRTDNLFVRGGARATGYVESKAPEPTPIPKGQIWNMVYDPDAPQGIIDPITHEQLWERYTDFLNEVLPVAEEAGVLMAAHPDDPPFETLRGTPRLVYQPRYYQKMIDVAPSPNNVMEFCVGTLSEMTEGDIYEVVDTYSKQNRIGYVHLRNVKGKVPNYHETFIDEGDTDIVRVLKILDANGFEGVIIPDHTPQMSCDAPWHAGMAYALGYIRGVLQAME